MNARKVPSIALIDLLCELQSLDRVQRAGFALRGVAEAESVAEHSWHVAFLVWTLGNRVTGLDRGRAIELALLHDVAEVRFGDLPRTAAHYLPKGAKRSAERAAFADLAAALPPDAQELHDEYQAAESLEARFVKACDKLQLMIKVSVYETWKTGALEDFWENEENFPDGGFEIIGELFAELGRRRQVAKSVF